MTTSSTSNCLASVVTWSQKVRQRRFGSTPSRMIASRPAPGSGAYMNVFSGHSIWRVYPSTSDTVGRVAWKSKKFSASIDANSIADHARARYAPASDAP